MEIHKAFKMGAQKIAADQCKYTTLHKSHGIEEANWNLLVQREYWSPDEARQIRNILASACEVSMTIAGMPAVPLPGQYVAAFISEVVAPPNQMLACVKAPTTFDAFHASGIMGEFKVQDMTLQQLMSLVILYNGNGQGEPHGQKLPKEVKQLMKKESAK